MTATLQAKLRPDMKKSTTREYRLNGHVPGVVYGKKTSSQPIAVDNVEFVKLMRDVGRNGIISLSVDGNNHQVIVTDIQQDPIKGELVHIDFFEVDMTSKMDAQVPVRLTGDAVGVEGGGMVSHLLHEVSVRCLPSEIPEHIDIDISGLAIGDSIQIRDVRINGNVEITNDPEETVVTVLHAPAEKEDGQQPDEVTEEAEAEASEANEAKDE